MTITLRKILDRHWVEHLLTLVLIGGLVRAMVHVYNYGYLPQPYFYDPADSWMDWFNTADWARDLGVYDSWGTVYPPLTFVFLRIFGLSACYEGGGGDSAYYARACDWWGIVFIHGIYLLNIVLIAIVYFRTDRSTALPRALAIAIGLPLTSALERGNLLILAFTLVMLAFGPIIRSARLRWLAIGAAINLKIYLVAAVFPQLLRRRWRWFEGAMLATVAIYLISYGLLGRGSPGEIFNNIAQFQGQAQPNQFLDIFYAASYDPLIKLLQGQSFPVNALIGSRNVDLMLLILPNLTRVVQVTIVAAAAAAWLRPEVIPMYRLTNLGLSFALITSESGGYTQLFPIFFTFFEKWRGVGPRIAIVCCYILSFQFDYILDRAPPLVHDTFFTNSTIFVTYYIMLGFFVRPLIFYIIPFALACSTLVAVWRDIRLNGWESRVRFRRDVQLF